MGYMKKVSKEKKNFNVIRRRPLVICLCFPFTEFLHLIGVLEINNDD